MPLDPDNLTPAASLNRVRLVSGPTLALPKHLEGRTAEEVLSANAIRSLITETAAGNGIELGDITNITDRLLAWLRSDREAEHQTAIEVAREHGERIACLISVLKLGEGPARAARPEWDESYWAHWSGVERVWLCGGLAYAEVAAEAERHLARFGVACTVKMAPNAALAPLIGAARCVSGASGTALVFDFGGTLVKRAVARYDAGVLASMRLMPPVPSPQRDGDRSPGALANIILETVRSAGLEMGERIEIGVSMASYLRDNHPLVALHGGYVNVDGVENLGKWLDEYVTRESGAPARVRLSP